MKGYPKHNSAHTHMQPARTPWTRLRIRQNRISPPSLDVILAQVNCSDDQTRVNLGEHFQAPGRTETERGRGANRFTPCRSVIPYSRSDVRGPRLNTAHRALWYICVIRTNKMSFFSLNLFQYSSSTCFEKIHYSSTGGILLYMQHVVFIMHLRSLATSMIKEVFYCIWSIWYLSCIYVD